LKNLFHSLERAAMPADQAEDTEKPKINILDIGSAPISKPPYFELLKSEEARIIGFEPNLEQFKKLILEAGPDEEYFNSAVGDGSNSLYRLYQSSGYNSIFAPCDSTAKLLGWTDRFKIKETQLIETQKLDLIHDLPRVDLLKIDIQGGELAVFQNGRRTLRSCSCIITEVNFLQLYEGGAPSFDRIHQELTSQGFILHKFLFTKSVSIKNSNSSLIKDKSQLVDGDAVYVKDFREGAEISKWNLQCISRIADVVLDSPDLAQYCLDKLAETSKSI